MMRVAVLVELIERGADRFALAALELREIDRHRQRELLTDVTQVEMHLVLGILAVAKAGPRLLYHLVVHCHQLSEIDAGEIGIDRAGEIVALVREQHAERRKMRRKQRHDHLRDVKLPRDSADMQRTRAAGRHQREVARVVALGDRHLAHRERHLVVRDLDDRLRGRDRIKLQRACDLLLDAAQGGSGIELHGAAEEIVRVEPAEHHIGVGDGRLGAAAAIADRPRIGARALRSHFERADVVAPRNRAAAGADLDHVDHRQHHRMAAGIAADVIARRQRRLALADQARLGRRAAHVERDHIGKSKRLPDRRRGDYAADRTRLHHGGRPLGCDLRRHHAAVRTHDRQVAAKADACQA